MKTIDLFAGVGGIRMGLERAGFDTVWANDFDKKAFLTYNKNFGAPAVDIRDLTTIDPNEIPEFDVLTGGFPCQSCWFRERVR